MVRAIAAAALVIAVAEILGFVAAAAQARTARSGAIQSGRLSAALSALSGQSGIRLNYDPALVAGLRSGGSPGNSDPATTLSQLLSNTGLVARRIDGRTFVVERVVRATGGAEVLGKVEVEGRGDAPQSPTSDPGATEGSGSYAARYATIFKTPLPPRDIPLTISVLTRERLDDQNLFELSDALVQAPGLAVTRTGEDHTVYSRGFEVNTEVDGVPLTASSGANRFDTAIYDRVEILRGPAGVLNGVGDIGGSINLVRKRPTEEFSANAQISYGSFSDFHGSLDVGGPINQSGTIRARFVGAYEDQDYFYDYVHLKHLTAYGVVEADLGPHTVLGVTASYTYSDRRGQYYGIPEALTDQVSRSTYPGVPWTGALLKASELGADITHDFGGGWSGVARYIHRESIYDYKYLQYIFSFDDPPTPTSESFFLAFEPQGKDVNDGIDASISGPIHLLGRDHHLTVGANYDRSLTSEGSPNTVAFGNAISPDIPPSVLGSNDEISKDRTIQFAPYAELKIELLKDLALTGGGRYTHYSYAYRNLTPDQPSSFVPYKKDNGHFTPYGGLTWDATKHISLYASYADIFQPSELIGFDGKPLPPVIGWQAETGVKGSFFGDRLAASAAVYRIREKNVAFTDPDPSHVNCGFEGGQCYVALGLTQSEGVEAEVTGRPVKGLQLQASYTYNVNKYIRNGDFVAGEAYETSTPKHQFKLWSSYQFGRMKRADTGRFSIGGGLLAQSKISFGSDDAYGQGAYAVFNAQAGYRPTENTQVTVTVNNIADRRYVESVGPNNFFGEPRSVLVSLRFAR